MAAHNIIIRENTGATKESAPYLGQYQAKGQVVLNDMLEAISADCGLPETAVLNAIVGSFNCWKAAEKESLVRFNTDIGQICGIITGTFASADAAFDPLKNTFELSLRLAEDIRLALVNEVPRIITDEQVIKVRVDNIMDLEYNRPMNLIHGTHNFRVAGLHLNMDDVGAEVYLTDSLGVKYTCTVVTKTSEQYFTAHTNALLEGGDYKLWVKSRGGDAEGPLQAVFRNVKYLKVVDPKAEAKFTDSSGTEVYTEIYPERSSLFFTCATHEFVNDEPVTLKKYNNAGTLLETVEKTLFVDGMGTAASCTNPFTAGAGNGKVTVENTAVFGEIAWLDAEP